LKENGGNIEHVLFWVVAPFSVVVVYQNFRGLCCLHLQGWSAWEIQGKPFLLGPFSRPFPPTFPIGAFLHNNPPCIFLFSGNFPSTLSTGSHYNSHCPYPSSYPACIYVYFPFPMHFNPEDGGNMVLKSCIGGNIRSKWAIFCWRAKKLQPSIQSPPMHLTCWNTCERQWMPLADCLSLHVQNISPYYLLNVFSVTFIFGKDLSHKGTCLGNMVEIQQFHSATATKGLWHWQPHECVHCYATWLVDACRNIAAGCR
jgi:hypothetical protein